MIEYVYYDRGNEVYCKTNGIELPGRYGDAIKIYDERRRLKEACGEGDYSYLDHREEETTTRDGYSIESIVNAFFNSENRQVWDKESNVTRIAYEEFSPPTLSVETRTVVNGDKRPK